MGGRSLRSALLVLCATALVAVIVRPPASRAESYQRISGEGSSWAAGAIDAMRVNVKQFGITVDYNPNGSSAGRRDFLNGTVDFAASDIPFQFHPEDGSAPENPAPGSYAYMPITAGGTSFMYNLKINGQRVTNLRLSGENVTKIFTSVIKRWNDPVLAADNPGLTLPDRPIVPVVRSDGSGSTAQFTQWMISQHGPAWTEYCQRSGRAPACGYTSFYPTVAGMVAQSGDLGVSGYVSQSFAEGAIGYVNYSYALGTGFPVAKVLNVAGYYTEPTPQNVAVSLLRAQINQNKGSDSYLTQQLDGVYTGPDPRTYPLSSYSYFILPTTIQGQFNLAKGKTLGAFSYYAMCQAQQQSASLGYSPMPVNLVQASFDQIRKIPGVIVQNIDIHSCNNPTFSSDGTNLLADTAPMPLACDQRGPNQCSVGTGGQKKVTTPVKPSAAGGNTAASGTPVTGGGSSASGATAGRPAGGATTGTGNGSSRSGPASGVSGIAGSSGGSSGTSSGTGTLALGTAGGGSVGTAACDPDTGNCGSVGSLAPGSASGGLDQAGVGAVAGQTTLLVGATSWSGSQTLMALVAALTVALVMLPAYLWRPQSAGGRCGESEVHTPPH
ncbi:MAG: hypothetical protein NVS3B21_13530 [Acidimicrobiales bacterium]